MCKQCVPIKEQINENKETRKENEKILKKR